MKYVFQGQGQFEDCDGRCITGVAVHINQRTATLGTSGIGSWRVLFHFRNGWRLGAGATFALETAGTAPRFMALRQMIPTAGAIP